MNIWNYFDRAYIINLPERSDRRREMLQMLTRLGINDPNWVEFFPAIRPESAGAFPSIGARGCFLSHLEVLCKAESRCLKNVLIMEDDLEINVNFSSLFPQMLDELSNHDWSMIYFGHILGDQVQSKNKPLSVCALPIQTTHFYAVNGNHYRQLINFLELVLSRPAGHPDGGPMHLDGAYSTFRQQNPSEITLIASPSLGWQRSSRSDIANNRWFDRTMGFRELATIFRHLIRPFRK